MATRKTKAEKLLEQELRMVTANADRIRAELKNAQECLRGSQAEIEAMKSGPQPGAPPRLHREPQTPRTTRKHKTSAVVRFTAEQVAELLYNAATGVSGIPGHTSNAAREIHADGSATVTFESEEFHVT